MPRKNPVTEREVEICHRLRAFRESKKLSRVAFAQLVGVDSTIISNVEHARAPLRYDVFAAVHRKFQINPHWLAIGVENAETQSGFDDQEILKHAKPRALFSEIYDAKLARASGSAGTWLVSANNTLEGLINHAHFETVLRERFDLAAEFEDLIGRAQAALDRVSGKSDKPVKKKKVQP